MTKKFDLDERLIEFASTIIDISEALPKTFAGNHIAEQLVRSGTSPLCTMEKLKVPNQEMILFIK